MSSPDSQASAVPSLGIRIGKGALVGLFAALLVGGLDALGSAQGVARQFDSAEQRLWFGLLTLLAPIPLFMLAAAAQSALSQLIVTLSRRFAGGEQLRAQRRWLGRSWALLATPGIVWVCSQIFAGPRAQQIPGHRLLAAVLAVVGVFAVSGSVQAGLRLLDWVKAGPRLGSRVGRAASLALPAAALLGLLYVADCRVLPRLYPFFHLSLQAALLLCAELCAAALLGISSRRFRGELLFFLALALLTGSWAGHRLQRAQTLRSLALEHTRLVAQVLRIEGTLRDSPRRPPLTPPAELLTAADLATPPQFVGPRLAGRDMFLITVDALRFDAVNPATMPFVSSLLPQAVVFHRAYTQVPHTSFAIATLLTGKPVYALLTLGQDAGSHETLPLILRRFRYKTAAFYPPSVFYVEHDRLRRLEESAYGFEYVKFEYLAAPQRTAQLMHFLDEERPQRVFAWVHYLEPHEPYDPHPGGPDASRPDRERYDGEVRFIDDELRRLVSYLQRTRPSAVLILAADHGEEFGEHGGRYHGTSLYEEQAHVPLLIVDLAKLASPQPGAAPPGAGTPSGGLQAQSIAQPVGLIDVAPTVLGLLDIEPSVRMRGHDLAPWLLAQAKSLPLWPVFSEIGRKKMIVRGDKKLICDFATDSCQAFDLQRDPQERRNTLDSDPQSAATLRMLLDRFIAEARRFEEQPAAAAPEPSAVEQAAALSRGRMGDRTALSALTALLTGTETPPAQRREALAVVAQLAAAALPDLNAGSAAARDSLLTEPPLADATTRARLRALFTQARRAAPPDPSWLRWTAILHLRLSAAGAEPDDLAAQAVVAALIGDEQAPAEQRFAAALALLALPRCQAATSAGAAVLPGRHSEPPQPHPAAAASAAPADAPPPSAATAAPDCVALWLTALPAAMSLDDPDRVRPLLLALGHSRDPRALSALQALIEPSVRSRPDLVTALGLLGNARAVPSLAERLASDPYVPVRTAAATALGRLGGTAAQSALRRAEASERESLVRTAIAAALTGAP